MTQVELVLLLPDPEIRGAAPRELVLAGTVVRSRPLPGEGTKTFETAIFFTDMKDDDREDVEAFVASRRSTTPSA
jgi:hypothetical protein